MFVDFSGCGQEDIEFVRRKIVLFDFVYFENCRAPVVGGHKVLGNSKEFLTL